MVFSAEIFHDNVSFRIFFCACNTCIILSIFDVLLLCNIALHIFSECDIVCLCRYSWCSKRLFGKSVGDCNHSLSLADLIPLETCSHECGAVTDCCQVPRLILGHNVSFDRSFIKEQYFVQVKVFCIAAISVYINL